MFYFETLEEFKEYVYKQMDSFSEVEELSAWIADNIRYLKEQCRHFNIKFKHLIPGYFWDIDRTLTHNALFNFIVGNRGPGKTYGGKGKGIDNFIKKKEQFLYIRRYKDDLSTSAPKLFDDIYEDYPEYEFKVEGTKFYIRLKPANEKQKWTKEDIAGYGVVLSTASNKKSISFPNVTTMIFDEFLLDEGNVRYIDGEVRKLLQLYETVARPGSGHPRVTLWCFANALSITNPYFLYFNLRMPTKQDKNGKWIWRHPTKSILVEDVRPELFMAAKRQDEFGKLIEGTDYAEYSIENKFLLDDSTFVERRSQKARQAFNFIYKDKTFGVWFDYSEAKMWVSEAYDPSAPTYAFTLKDHRPNTTLLKSKYKDYYFKNFIAGFKDGSLFFENINIKNMCYEILKMILY